MAGHESKPPVATRFVAVAFVAILASVGLSGCTTFWQGEREGSAPAFELTDLDGAAHNLTLHAGSYVLLDFMGTWCDICERSRPRLAALDAAYPNLVILSVSATDSAGEMEDYRHRVHNPWPMAVDTDGVTKRYTEAGGARTPMYPSYALIGPAGEWLFWTRGETFPAVIADHLGSPSDAAVELPWLQSAVALVLGVGLWFNPYAAAGSLADRDAATRQRHLAGVLGFIGLVLALVLFGARPVAGRLYVPTLVSMAAAPAMIWWWRHRGTEAIQPKERGHDGWRRDVGHVGHILFVGLPVLLPVLMISLSGLSPLEVMLPVAALGLGLSGSSIMDMKFRSPKTTLWAGAATIIAGAIWSALLILLPNTA